MTTEPKDTAEEAVLAADLQLSRLPLIVVTGMVVFLALMMLFQSLPGCQSRVPGRRGQCQNNLHNIALALIQYEDCARALPGRRPDEDRWPAA